MPPLLVIEHEVHCPSGWVGDWLVEAGVELDVRRPYGGDALPAHLDDHSGLLILGGSMDPYAGARFPWLEPTMDLVRTAAAQETPVLGICLGLQLIAVALGGDCGRNPLGQLIGLVDVGWLEEAHHDPLLAPLTAARDAVHWNDDLVTRLPEGAVPLAATGRGELQAARFGTSVWGVQWHPEVDAGIIGVWAEHDRDRAVDQGVDVDAQVARVAAAHDDLRAAWRGLATGFAALLRQSAPTL